MISRGFEKKPSLVLTKQINIKKKSKSKSKSKQKLKKFSAKDFLQALIDLQTTNCTSNKKKGNSSRDITSALAITTPNLQKTIQSSKKRSKSSYSQYRQKIIGTVKQPMSINLCAVMTEQDNIQYTQKTARSSHKQQQCTSNKTEVVLDSNKRKLSQNICAIKIQRAWRYYQTYKMVHSYYLKYKKTRQIKLKKLDVKPTHQLHIKICKPDLQKTLRIKKQNAIKKQERKQQQYSQTRKIIKQRWKQQNNSQDFSETVSKQLNESIQMNSCQSISFIVGQQSTRLKCMKQRQTIMLNQIIELIQKQGKSETKQQLINKLIKKCQDNKRILQKDIKIQEPALQYQKQHNSAIKINQLRSQKQYQHQETHKNSIVQIKDQIYYNQQLISINQPSQFRNSFELYYEDTIEEIQQIKIFQQQLESIKNQKMRKLKKIDNNLLQNRISTTDAIHRKQLVYDKYEKQRDSIERNRKQYLFSLSKLKKLAMNCQKSVLQHNLSSSKIRKSFSVGNTIIKQVLEDLKIFQIQKQEQQIQFKQFLSNKNKITIETTQNSKLLTNTPIFNLSPKSKIQSQQQFKQSKNTNTQVLKQYSLQIQELIQKQLIDQFVSTAFLDERLFEYFKPYIQQIYEFKKIPDAQIIDFIDKLQPYITSNQSMLQRVNQKINPTAMQILRIIRDYNYQIQQYQLIIPEQSFKKYRAGIQKEYEQKNQQNTKPIQIPIKLKKKQIKQKVHQLQQQKKQKMKKYRSFERDLKIMYMKSVFNCVNQFLIQIKSNNTYMNGRSSIGPGQLSLAIKQYNQNYNVSQYQQLLNQVKKRLERLIYKKCSIPSSFNNYQDIQMFQKQVMIQIQLQSNENEFKWVNYMDEVLQIWQDLSIHIIQLLASQAAYDIFLLLT